MKLLTNPLFLRMVAVAVSAGIAFLVGMLLMKKVRRKIQQEGALSEGDPSTEAFPMHTYHAVIQQLKQQKHELQALQQQERRRSQTTENLSATVLANLSSGVLFFNTAGLIRQANAAAKAILGFAAPAGMNAKELFRAATVDSQSDPPVDTAADAIIRTLNDGSVFRRLEINYVTPAGQHRVLDLTVSPVYSTDAQPLGASCVIEDHTEVAEMRRNQALLGDVSAEMALELRSSLATISEYARKLASNYDPKSAEQLAADIAAEAGHLQHKIGGFLAAGKASGTASGMN